MAIDDGGPAYPGEQHEREDGSWNMSFDPGMTVREHYVGQALAAADMKDMMRIMINDPQAAPSRARTIARAAIMVADAAISEQGRA